MRRGKERPPLRTLGAVLRTLRITTFEAQEMLGQKTNENESSAKFVNRAVVFLSLGFCHSFGIGILKLGFIQNVLSLNTT